MIKFSERCRCGAAVVYEVDGTESVHLDNIRRMFESWQRTHAECMDTPTEPASVPMHFRRDKQPPEEWEQ